MDCDFLCTSLFILSRFVNILFKLTSATGPYIRTDSDCIIMTAVVAIQEEEKNLMILYSYMAFMQFNIPPPAYRQIAAKCHVICVYVFIGFTRYRNVQVHYYGRIFGAPLEISMYCFGNSARCRVYLSVSQSPHVTCTWVQFRNIM